MRSKGRTDELSVSMRNKGVICTILLQILRLPVSMKNKGLKPHFAGAKWGKKRPASFGMTVVAIY
jgi:hypothetical protein